jgi:hypothetical protein
MGVRFAISIIGEAHRCDKTSGEAGVTDVFSLLDRTSILRHPEGPHDR